MQRKMIQNTRLWGRKLEMPSGGSRDHVSLIRRHSIHVAFNNFSLRKVSMISVLVIIYTCIFATAKRLFTLLMHVINKYFIFCTYVFIITSTLSSVLVLLINAFLQNFQEILFFSISKKSCRNVFNTFFFFYFHVCLPFLQVRFII